MLIAKLTEYYQIDRVVKCIKYIVSEYTVMTGPSYQLFCLLVVSDFPY